MSYERFGILACCASNGIMNVERVKHLIDQMQKMNYDLLELCIDDTYKIDGEPYFGYLRGGYTKEELREMDSYAKAHGVELVPCIQTLAHMENLVKVPYYSSIVDINDILLVDEPKTYELIEKMFKSLREALTTDIVNIGFDEAHHVGLGKYLDKHGYTNRYELLLRHLNKVVEIAKKYGFKVHMWSDMFFRLANKGPYYAENAQIPQEVIDKVPKNVALCYWDYGEGAWEESRFDTMFEAHKAFNRELWFAGGAWCWNGFAPLNHYTLLTMERAMTSVKKNGVKNVIITLWSNNGSECSFYSVLPSLYAIRQFADGNNDMESIKRGFYQTFGLDFDKFMLLDIPNKTSRNPDWRKWENPCKLLLYNDCFLGLKDKALSLVDEIPYGQYAKELEAVASEMGEYKYLFDNLAALCRVLEIKAYLGLRTREAYQSGGKAALKSLLNDYTETAKRVDTFRRTMRKVWMTDNKPYGWEIMTVRLSGLAARIRDCRERIKDYLSGKVDKIPELEEELLVYGGAALQGNRYTRLITVSEI